jgi:preprotein translocase subunit SecB
MAEQNPNYKIINIVLIDSEFKNLNSLKAHNTEEYSKLKRNINIEIGKNTDSQIIQSFVTVTYQSEFENGEKEIECKIKMGASFEILGEGDKRLDPEKFSTINGPAIIFPYIREYLSSLSIKAGIPPIVLPPYNFTILPKPDKEQ